VHVLRKPLLWLGPLAVLLLVSAASAQTLEEKVKEFTLENGMHFIVVERHEAPVFFGAIAFKVGSINERPGIYGISHLLEHMLFKGTQTIGTKDYKAEKKYLDKEDQLALHARDLMMRIEPWRLDYFDTHSTDVIASFGEDERKAIGTDRALELELLVERLTAEAPPEDFVATSGLLEDREANYFDLYLELERTQMALYDTMAEHRKLIVSNEFWETYLANGARMLNAGTSNDGTYYFVALPSNRVELWALMESDRMANPVFREFYSERDVVMEERRMHENEPESELDESFTATAYSASMYHNPIVGWMSDLKMITRKDLEAYYKANYGPNTATALLVGDVSFEQAKALAQKYFGALKPTPPLPYLTTNEPPQNGERRVVLKSDAKPTLMIGYHVPAMPHPDSYALEVLSSILSGGGGGGGPMGGRGGGRTSRFYKSIYEEQGLTRAAPQVYIGPGERLDPLFTIGADPKEPHTLEEVEGAIYAEFDRLKKEPVSSRELERVRNQLEADMVRSLGSNIGLAFRVGSSAMRTGDWRTVLDDMERMKAVTSEDITRVANKYFTEENRTVGWLVETQSQKPEAGEKIDFRALMGWVQTLPEAEQKDLMLRFQSLDDKGREALARELLGRMKAEKGSK
jgi:predicted Zn-dependent peptidase